MLEQSSGNDNNMISNSTETYPSFFIDTMFFEKIRDYDNKYR